MAQQSANQAGIKSFAVVVVQGGNDDFFHL